MSTYLSSSFINVIPAEAGIQLTAMEENRCSKHITNQHHLLNLKLLVIEQQLCPQSSKDMGNSRIVKFSSNGEYLFQWGSKGNEPGQFIIPHGIDLDKNGNVYVADRENNRIQKFDSEGNFIQLWQNDTTEQLYSVTIDETREHLFGIDYMTVNDTIIKGSDIFRFDLNTNLQVQFGRTANYDGPNSKVS